MENNNLEPSKFQRGEWVWTCRSGPNKLIRDYAEVDEIDAEGKITHLADGRKLSFLKCLVNSIHDVYMLPGADIKVLVQRPLENSIESIELKTPAATEFSWK